MIAETEEALTCVPGCEYEQEATVTTAQAAVMLEVSEKHLRLMRREGWGPNFEKRGQRYCYFVSDFMPWLEIAHIPVPPNVTAYCNQLQQQTQAAKAACVCRGVRH
jgi:hypothetical protein